MTSRRTWAYILAGSMALHTPVMFPKQIEKASRPFRTAAAALADGYEQYKIRNSRMFLVSKARDDVRKGKLKLGEFVLKTNRIDAREEGRRIDYGKVLEDYDRRVAALKKAEKEKSGGAKEAVAEVFSDIDYFGKPGGLMADALIDKGGSCVQITHLLVSSVYDAGHKDGVYLRHYGANSAGISHVAPVMSDNGRQYDLMAGAQAMMKPDGNYAGVMEPATGLIEDYARAHGIPTKDIYTRLDGEDGKGAEGKTAVAQNPNGSIEGRSTGFSGRASTDVFAEGIPSLYSKHGIGKFNGMEQKMPAGNGNAGFDISKYNSLLWSLGSQSQEERGRWPARELPDTVRFDSPAFSDETLTEACRAIAVVQEHMLIEKSDGSSLADMGRISLMAEIAEFQARGLEKHKLADWAVDERRKAVRQAQALIERNSKQGREKAAMLMLPANGAHLTVAGVNSLGAEGSEIAFNAMNGNSGDERIAGTLKVKETMVTGQLWVKPIDIGRDSFGKFARLEIVKVGKDSAIVTLREGDTFGARFDNEILNVRAKEIQAHSTLIAISKGNNAGVVNHESMRNLSELIRRPSSRRKALEIAEKLEIEKQFELAGLIMDIEIFPDSQFSKRQNAIADFSRRLKFGNIVTENGTGLESEFDRMAKIAAESSYSYDADAAWKDLMIFRQALMSTGNLLIQAKRKGTDQTGRAYMASAKKWLDTECGLWKNQTDDSGDTSKLWLEARIKEYLETDNKPKSALFGAVPVKTQ